METNIIETWAAAEFREGVSAGAAARQLCRLLGAHAEAPTLKRMLEEMLATANRASHDRSCILRRFRECDEEAAHAAEMESFHRINGIERPIEEQQATAA